MDLLLLIHTLFVHYYLVKSTTPSNVGYYQFPESVSVSYKSNKDLTNMNIIVTKILRKSMRHQCSALLSSAETLHNSLKDSLLPIQSYH